jgi:hypothetical protein
MCSLGYPARYAHAPYGVASLAVQYFSKLSHKRHDFRINVVENKICVLIFPPTFVWNVSREKPSEIWSKMYIGLHVKYRLLRSEFNKILKFLGKKKKNRKISNFMKIPTVGGGGCRVPCGRTAGGHYEDCRFSQFSQTRVIRGDMLYSSILSLSWLRFSHAFPQLLGKCQGKTRKDGARPALFQIIRTLCCSVVICVVLCIVCVINVYCTTATGCQLSCS